jgi:DNA-binding transcriptional ArsR family regulator
MGGMNPQAIFAALSDQTRLDIFEQLASDGPASATEIARVVPVTRQAVAKHLSVLDEAGLVERTQAGREVRYAARPAVLGSVVTWVNQVGDEWDRRLDRLREAIDES